MVVWWLIVRYVYFFTFRCISFHTVTKISIIEEPLDDIQQCVQIEECLILSFSGIFMTDWEKCYFSIQAERGGAPKNYGSRRKNSYPRSRKSGNYHKMCSCGNWSRQVICLWFFSRRGKKSHVQHIKRNFGKQVGICTVPL